MVYGGTVDASQPFEVVHPPPSRIAPSLSLSLSLARVFEPVNGRLPL